MLKKLFALRNTITYLIYAIILGGTSIYLNLNFSSLSMMAVLFLDVILSFALIFMACAIVCFVANIQIRDCVINAVLFTIISFIITTTVSSFVPTDAGVVPDIESDVTDDMDWLDRQAYEEMLRKGLIEEGEEIYGEPYVGENDVPSTDEDSNASTGENDIAYSKWDVQVVKPTISDRILNVVLTFIVGFLGGIGGMGLKKRCMKTLEK